MTRGANAALAAAAMLSSAAPVASETVRYTYDALGRLTGVSAAGGPNDGVAVSTGYDPAGNRSNHSLTGAGAAGLAPASSSASSGEEATGQDAMRAEEEEEREELPAATVEAPPPGGIPDESEPAVEIAPPEDNGAAVAEGPGR